MRVLVDSSIWIDYFKGGGHSTLLDQFIEDNLICSNDVILAELVPLLKIKKQSHLIELLYTVANIPLAIRWQKIVDYQVINLRKGIKQVGIPDLVIVDHVVQNDLSLYTLDGHFKKMSKYIPFKLV